MRRSLNDARPSLLVAAMLGAATAFFSSSGAYAQTGGAELKVIDTLKLGGAGRWDYAVVDAGSSRLYIARGDHVQVVDLKSRKPVGDVTGLQGAHGTAVVADKGLGFATSGRENAVVVFDLDSLKESRRLKTPEGGGRNPDAILYDPASKKVFAFCAGGDAVVIDPADLDAPLTSIPCDGKLEFGQADGAGRVFVNNEDKSEVVVIDSKTLQATAHWPVAPAEGPSGLAIDVARHRLYSVGGNQKMAVIDSESGKLLASVAIGKGVDGCAFDPKLGVALSANGADGTVTVVHEGPPGEFKAVQTLPTLKSGRTIGGDSKTSRFYVPATIPAEGDNPAQFGVVVIGLAP